jgi:hypothetical protein
MCEEGDWEANPMNFCLSKGCGFFVTATLLEKQAALLDWLNSPHSLGNSSKVYKDCQQHCLNHYWKITPGALTMYTQQVQGIH